MGIKGPWHALFDKGERKKRTKTQHNMQNEGSASASEVPKNIGIDTEASFSIEGVYQLGTDFLS